METYTDHELASHIYCYIVNQTLATDVSTDVKQAQNKGFLHGLELAFSDEQLNRAETIIRDEYVDDLRDDRAYGPAQAAEALALLDAAIGL